MSRNEYDSQFGPQKFLSDPEFKHLLGVLDRNKDKDVRNVLFLELALATGARCEELTSIKKEQIQAHNKSIYIVAVKDGNNRNIPIKAPLFHRIIRYMNTVEGDVLFPFTTRNARYIWDEYRPVKKKFHSLRHTFAIRLFEKHRDIRLVQVALGHKSIETTLVYANYIYSQQELRRLLL